MDLQCIDISEKFFLLFFEEFDIFSISTSEYYFKLFLFYLFLKLVKFLEIAEFIFITANQRDLEYWSKGREKSSQVFLFELSLIDTFNL